MEKEWGSEEQEVTFLGSKDREPRPPAWAVSAKLHVPQADLEHFLQELYMDWGRIQAWKAFWTFSHNS